MSISETIENSIHNNLSLAHPFVNKAPPFQRADDGRYGDLGISSFNELSLELRNVDIRCLFDARFQKLNDI
jgi:hypothetical protein